MNTTAQSIFETIGFGPVRAPEDAINQGGAGCDDIRFRQDQGRHVAVVLHEAVVGTGADVTPDSLVFGARQRRTRMSRQGSHVMQP